MRIAVALFFFVHGFAHLVGFVGPWRLSEKVPYKTTLFADTLDVGDAGIKVVGVLWLLLAIAFGIAGGVAWARLSWWPSYSLVVSLVSLLMCSAGWPEARIGAAVNGVLIMFLVIGARAGWFAAAAGSP